MKSRKTKSKGGLLALPLLFASTVLDRLINPRSALRNLSVDIPWHICHVDEISVLPRPGLRR